MSIERTGIVEELQRRRALFARFLPQRPIDPGAHAEALIQRKVNARLKAEVEAIVERRLAAQREEIEALSTPKVKLRTIVAVACDVTGKRLEEMVGPRRARDLAWPRHFAFWLVKELRPDLSLMALGKVFNRDHTTIMHGLKRVSAMRDEAPFKQWFAHADVVALLAVSP